MSGDSSSYGSLPLFWVFRSHWFLDSSIWLGDLSYNLVLVCPVPFLLQILLTLFFWCRHFSPPLRKMYTWSLFEVMKLFTLIKVFVWLWLYSIKYFRFSVQSRWSLGSSDGGCPIYLACFYEGSCLDLSRLQVFSIWYDIHRGTRICHHKEFFGI